MRLSSCCEVAFLISVQVKRSQIRKGMVMVSPSLKPTASLEFEADILVLHHPTTINPRYQAMGTLIAAIISPSANRELY